MKEPARITKITRETKLHELMAIAACSRCNHCCSYGSGIFLADDIKRVAAHMGVSEDKFTEEYLWETLLFNKKVHRARLRAGRKPYGPCIFLKRRGCSIQSVKPLHCRVCHGCGSHGENLAKWFMVNYIIDTADPEAVRQYAIYLRTHSPLEGASLNDLVPDKALLSRILSLEKLY